MEDFELSIETLMKKVEEKEKDLIETKKGVNQVCLIMGKEPIYIIEETGISKVPIDLKGDEYYCQPLATVITTILENRRIRGSGPAMVKEIYDQMVAGGYLFETKSTQNAMRNIRISMGKNVVTFHKLPNGKFGLVKWYPELKNKKQEVVKPPKTKKITKDEQGKPPESSRRRGRPRKESLPPEKTNEENDSKE